MKLSIIVPVYNVEDYLDECISSLFNQSLNESDFEVILIDDGSSDSSLSIAYKWSLIHDNIKVYHQENQGQAVARNLGIDNAGGDYLMFVDSDDFLYMNTLLGPLNCISDNDYDCVHFDMGVELKNGTVVYNHLIGPKVGATYSGEYVALNFDICSSICVYIFKSVLFKSNNLRFKIGFAHEDSELCFRLFPRINTMHFHDSLVYQYRYNHNSTDRSNSLSSIRRRYNSDLFIAAELKKLIYTEELSIRLKKHYKRVLNSLVTSHYLYYRKISNLFDTKEQYYSTLRDLGLYPLNGRCLTLRATILLFALNFKCYLSCSIRNTSN